MSTDGKVFDRVDLVWREPEVQRQINEIREELYFLSRPKQGELTCPMYIPDGMDPVKSMLDGEMYDSKSKLRRTYREGGVEEVGNDPDYTDPERMRRKRDTRTIYEKKAQLERLRGTVERAYSLANLTTSTPGDDVRVKRLEVDPSKPVRFHGMK